MSVAAGNVTRERGQGRLLQGGALYLRLQLRWPAFMQVYTLYSVYIHAISGPATIPLFTLDPGYTQAPGSTVVYSEPLKNLRPFQ